MARNQRTVWNCDKCGKREDTDTGSAPVGWRAITIKPLDPIGADSDSIRTVEVCDACGLNTARFLQPTNRPDNGLTRSGPDAH